MICEKCEREVYQRAKMKVSNKKLDDYPNVKGIILTTLWLCDDCIKELSRKNRILFKTTTRLILQNLLIKYGK